MKKLSVFAALAAAALLLASCDPTPAVSPDGPPSVPASPSGELSPPEASVPAPSAPASAAPTGGPSAPLPSAPDVSRDWEDNGLTVTSLTYQKDYTSDGSVALSASGRFPQTGVAGIDQYYSFCLEDFVRYADSAALSSPGGMGAGSLECDYAVECSSGGVFSVSRSFYEYAGGVHGTESVICENFSAASGRLLTLSDFFTVDQAAYTERLLQAIYEFIDSSDAGLFEQAKEIIREAFPYDSFVVTKNGVSFLFSPYAIGPYSAGTVRIDIGWETVYDIWTMPG